MKLYTEFEVNELRRALKDIVQWNEDMEDDWEDVGHRAIDALKSFEKLTPIELPSDEEIEKEASDFGKKYRATTYEVSAYVIAAKWMREKIQGGSK